MAKFTKWISNDLKFWFHINALKCCKTLGAVEIVCRLKKHKCEDCFLKNMCNRNLQG